MQAIFIHHRHQLVQGWAGVGAGVGAGVSGAGEGVEAESPPPLPQADKSKMEKTENRFLTFIFTSEWEKGRHLL